MKYSSHTSCIFDRLTINCQFEQYRWLSEIIQAQRTSYEGRKLCVSTLYIATAILFGLIDHVFYHSNEICYRFGIDEVRKSSQSGTSIASQISYGLLIGGRTGSNDLPMVFYAARLLPPRKQRAAAPRFFTPSIWGDHYLRLIPARWCA